MIFVKTSLIVLALVATVLSACSAGNSPSPSTTAGKPAVSIEAAFHEAFEPAPRSGFAWNDGSQRLGRR